MRAHLAASGGFVERLAPPLKADLAKRRLADDRRDAAQFDQKSEDGRQSRAVRRRGVGQRKVKILIALGKERPAIIDRSAVRLQSRLDVRFGIAPSGGREIEQ